MADTRCAFKYVHTGPGDLSGPELQRQTERAINDICGVAYQGYDMGEEGLSTAQQALQEAQNATVTADNADAKAEEALARSQTAQDAAETANATANQALEEARAAQSGVDSNTDRLDALEQRTEEIADTAENAQNRAEQADEKAETAQEGVESNKDSIDSLEATVSDLSVTVDSLRTTSCFVYDEETTDIDQFVDEAVRVYLPQECTTVPSGAIFPYWVWSYATCDGAKLLMWLRDSQGSVWSREGDYDAGTLADGTETLGPLDVPNYDGELSITETCADEAVTVTTTAGELSDYTCSDEGLWQGTLTLELTAALEEGDEIKFGDIVLGTVDEYGNVMGNEEAEVAGEHCTLALSSGSTEGTTLTLVFSGTWKERTGAVSEWGEWTALGGGGSGTVSQAYVTLTEDLASGSAVSTQGVTYAPGTNRLSVYYEGVKLIVGANYEETDSSTITLLFDADSGSTLEFVYR